jgi:hypothetical protein
MKVRVVIIADDGNEVHQYEVWWAANGELAA